MVQTKSAQRQIIEAFLAAGVSTELKDGKGKSVAECAKSEWIQQLLIEHAAENR